jgi:DNA-binding MarR family transcriptional regulator
VTQGNRLDEPADLQSETFREVIALMYASIGRLQAMRRTLAQSLGVDSSGMATLLALNYLQRRGEVNVASIAKHLHVAAANTTSTLSRLEADGWIAKGQHSQDTRKLAITLTPKAQQALVGLSHRLEKVNLNWFQGISNDEFECVRTFFENLEKRFPVAINVAASDD